MKTDISRRKFVTALGAIPIIAVTQGSAQAATQVDPEGAQAKALSYVHQSAMSDKNCANCQLYTGNAGAEWGPCALFPGQEVAAAGWCQAWVAKA